MKRSTKITRKNTEHFTMAFFVLAFLLFGLVCPYTAWSQGGSAPRIVPVNSKNIRDYVCVVNRYVHPNMERFLNNTIGLLMRAGDEGSDNLALRLEGAKRGGFGSGFVYLDSKGNNYIITNYHVIVGAYRLSVTFEDDNGKKTTYKNLSVFGVNEQEDMAILAFPAGVKPFRRGLKISTTRLQSANRISAAGYPGFPEEPTWSFTSDTISNPRVMIRGYPYIRHGATISPGNSGGPLLIENRSSYMGYDVAGINTMYLERIPGSFLSIPAERLDAFLQRSFRQTVTLDSRVRLFMELLQKSTTSDPVYEEFSSFLSSTMINANPLQTLQDLPERGVDDIHNKVDEDPVVGIVWAVAYNQIENEIYKNSRRPLAQRGSAEFFPPEENNMGGYTVRLLVNGYPYRSEWIWEYSTWKLDDFSLDDGEYNDYPHLATSHPLAKRVIYSLSSGRDYDWYTLTIPRSGRLTVRTEGNTDTVLYVCYDPTDQSTRIGANERENDDAGQNLNAQVTSNVRAGTVYVRVRLMDGRPGEYILVAGVD